VLPEDYDIKKKMKKISIRLIKVSPSLYKWCIHNYYLPIIPNNQYSFTSKEIKQILQKRIDERKKEVRPDLLNQRYVEQIIMEIEIFRVFRL
jgi:hypothetical protein